MYTDFIKILAKNEEKKTNLETLIQTLRIYFQDWGMDFAVEKCAIVIMKKGKKRYNGKNIQPNPVNFKTQGKKENYKYFEILEACNIKQTDIKGNE